MTKGVNVRSKKWKLSQEESGRPPKRENFQEEGKKKVGECINPTPIKDFPPDAEPLSLFHILIFSGGGLDILMLIIFSFLKSRKQNPDRMMFPSCFHFSIGVVRSRKS